MGAGRRAVSTHRWQSIAWNAVWESAWRYLVELKTYVLCQPAVSLAGRSLDK